MYGIYGPSFDGHVEPVTATNIHSARWRAAFAKLMPACTAAMKTGDRDKLNPARPTRTRFYSARFEA